MTVEQVIQETKSWKPEQRQELLAALTSATPPDPELVKARLESFRKFTKKIDEIWTGSNSSMSEKEIIELLDQSRGRG